MTTVLKGDQRMNGGELVIEIRKAGFENKGAELMLRAVLSRLRDTFPDAKFIMTPDTVEAPYEKRAGLKLLQKAYLPLLGLDFAWLFDLLPPRLLASYGIIGAKNVDVIIDAAGFAYTDQWGVSACSTLANTARQAKKRGRLLILLPQAFGPFELASNQRSMAKVLENASLVFARDEVSYQHLRRLKVNSSNILKSPDFTNTLCKDTSLGSKPDSRGVCLIPNYRMIDKVEAEEGNAYIEFMVCCVNYLIRNNLDPYLLVHEGSKDSELAAMINERSASRIRIIVESDALNIKEIIGQSHAIIGSRYHGLVNALSQGVPALATGWSHKYETLFEEYDCSDGLLDVSAGKHQLYEVLDNFFSEGYRQTIVGNLAAKNIRFQRLTGDMWGVVESLIVDHLKKKNS